MVRVLSVKFWLALMLAFTVSACQSTRQSQTAEESAAEQQAAQDPNAAAATGVGDEEAVQGADGEDALSAANWAHHSSQYSGDTRTFVIYFDYDQSTIPPEAYETLKAHAMHIADTARVELVLEGHTDLRGTPEYNIALGERRAKSVETFLKANGAHPPKMTIVSYGEEKPVAFGEDELSFAKNRRVQLNYKVGRP